MTTAFVLGNGVSRHSIDPAALKYAGTIYGCNALYRTFAPDVLVSTDTPISEAIQLSGYSADNIHYTRKPLAGLGAHQIPAEYYGFSSGPIAVALAAAAGNNRIFLLGFDLGPSHQGKFNNIYADTEFYKKSSLPPTYSGNWIKQIVSITDEFTNVSFIRIVGDTTATVSQFDGTANIQHMSIKDLADRINNGKDL
jgi:hypothetical protein